MGVLSTHEQKIQRHVKRQASVLQVVDSSAPHSTSIHDLLVAETWGQFELWATSAERQETFDDVKSILEAVDNPAVEATGDARLCVDRIVASAIQFYHDAIRMTAEICWLALQDAARKEGIEEQCDKGREIAKQFVLSSFGELQKVVRKLDSETRPHSAEHGRVDSFAPLGECVRQMKLTLQFKGWAGFVFDIVDSARSLIDGFETKAGICVFDKYISSKAACKDAGQGIDNAIRQECAVMRFDTITTHIATLDAKVLSVVAGDSAQGFQNAFEALEAERSHATANMWGM